MSSEQATGTEWLFDQASQVLSLFPAQSRHVSPVSPLFRGAQFQAHRDMVGAGGVWRPHHLDCPF